ncbi:MAG: hypothetical protein K2X46_08130 [Roseomonas sp.]|nr:hypothetical protein [Roseomonas sp.]
MMDPALARRSRRRFFFARTLNRAARAGQGICRGIMSCTAWLIARSREQERIANALWAEAVAAKRPTP